MPWPVICQEKITIFRAFTHHFSVKQGMIPVFSICRPRDGFFRFGVDSLFNAGTRDNICVNYPAHSARVSVTILKNVSGVLAEAKSTMQAWHFCKEAAFAASQNPTLHFLGIRFRETVRLIVGQN